MTDLTQETSPSPKETFPITRRQMLTVLLASVTISTLESIDQISLKGTFTKALLNFLTNSEYRDKVLARIHQGQGLDKFQRLTEQATGYKAPHLELGEPMKVSESWFASTFRKCQVYKVHENSLPSDKLIITAELGRPLIIEAVLDPLPGTRLSLPNFKKTVARNPQFAMLPSSQVAKDDATNNYVPLMSSAYQISSGEIKSWQDQLRSGAVRGGSLVVQNNEFLVVNPEKSQKYIVGENGCKAKETFAFSVDSSTKNEDLKIINETKNLGDVQLADSPRYDNFLASFQSPGQDPKTILISTFRSLDERTNQISGQDWDLERMTIVQGVQLCDQILNNLGAGSYTLIVPDPDWMSTVYLSKEVPLPLAQKILGGTLNPEVGFWRSFGRSSPVASSPFDLKSIFLASTNQ